MTISNRAAAEAWLRDQLKDADPFFVDEALAYIRRTPPRGGSGEARAAVPGPTAPILMQFPDMDGNPVFFDPKLVTGVREVVNKARGVWNTMVFVGMPGGTTQVYTVFERAQMVGDRINMYRRGYGPQLEAALGRSGKLVIPETMEFTEEKFFSDVPDAAEAVAAEADPDTLGKVFAREGVRRIDIPETVFTHTEGAGRVPEKSDLDISLAEDELS